MENVNVVTISLERYENMKRDAQKSAQYQKELLEYGNKLNNEGLTMLKSSNGALWFSKEETTSLLLKRVESLQNEVESLQETSKAPKERMYSLKACFLMFLVEAIVVGILVGIGLSYFLT